ncbi:SAM-dependent MidA family methyltransferase [Salirhabdus euzebyi]|uniref:SAM-dependent MidA family methyltransferase n=1 Tax=Salirhabdus euzebyi TaxID=394506 RepID=A0A841Q7F4_9BACI|nr:class I SAM-dependent methyltransferase [Salirhabdus euzebyi]MBB6454264.1 SAM-dependent MidA family methyltransferase [Salirhabdus euzebyi]
MVDYFLSIWEKYSLPFAICELGGGDGTFALQFGNIMRKRGKNNIQYIFVEQNEWGRQNVLKNLPRTWDVQVFTTIDDFINSHSHFNGIIFSNEFLDAQPVRVIEKSSDEIYEIYITMDKQLKLTETKRPCSEDLLYLIADFDLEITNGQRIEVPIYINPIMSKISRLLREGFVITVDYGYLKQDWEVPSRREGSLRGYYKHQLNKNVLNHVGEMDITHHVHWEPWIAEGNKHGLTCRGLVRQNEFLLHHCNILQYLKSNNSTDAFSGEAKRNRAIRSLILDDGLSQLFDVCIQQKKSSSG